MNRIELRGDDVLILHGSDSFNPQELNRVLEPLGFEAYVGTRFSIAEAEIKQLLVTEGISGLWRKIPLREAVLPGPVDDRAPLLRLLAEMIRRLAAERDFVIVDPYLLPNEPRGDYLYELIGLLELVAARVARLHLVTMQFNERLFGELSEELAERCPHCAVTHVRSRRYHDRFWMADESRGLFVGTSLNGVGRRYALADFLDSNDVAEIIGDLRTEGLLTAAS
jgi:hypothetical protein